MPALLLTVVRGPCHTVTFSSWEGQTLKTRPASNATSHHPLSTATSDDPFPTQVLKHKYGSRAENYQKTPITSGVRAKVLEAPTFASARMAAFLLFHLRKDRALVFSYQTWTKQHKRQRVLCEWLLSLLLPEPPTSSSHLPHLAFKTHLRENLPVEFSWKNEILF